MTPDELNADALRVLGDAQAAHQNGDLGNAQVLYEQAANLFTEAKNQRGLAATLTNFGVACAASSNYPKAIELLELALTHHVATNDISGLAHTAFNLATTLFETGQFFHSVAHFENANNFFRQLDPSHDLALKASEFAEKIRTGLPAGIEPSELVRRDRLSAQLITSMRAGEASFLNQNFSNAIQFWSKSLEASLALEHEERSVAIVNQIAAAMCHLGQAQNGRAMFESALQKAIGTEDGLLIALSENNLGCLLLDLGETLEAEKHLNSALQRRGEFGDVGLIAETKTNLGVSKARLGKFAEATSLFKEAQELFSAVGNNAAVKRLVEEFLPAVADHRKLEDVRSYPPVENLPFNELLAAADIHAEAGEIEQANEKLKEAINQARGVNDSTAESVALIALGYANRRAGNESEALLAYHQALTAARSADDKVLEARALNNIGVLYSDNDSETARRFLESARDIREQLNDSHELGETIISLANLAFESEAKKLAESALELLDPKRSPSAWYSAYSILESQVSSAEKPKLADLHAATLSQIGKGSVEDAARDGKLEILHDLIELDDGIGLIVESPEGSKKTASFEFHKQITKSNVLWETGNRSEAIEELKEALKNFVRLGKNFLTLEARSDFMRRLQFAFDRLLTYLLDEDRVAEGLGILEQIKAQSLKEAIDDYDFLSDVVPVELQQSYRRLLKQKKLQEEDLAELQKSAWKGEDAAIGSLRGSMAIALASLEHTVSEIRKIDPNFLLGTEISTLTGAQAVELLRSDKHGIVAYWLGMEVVGAFVISRAEIEFVRLDSFVNLDDELEMLQSILNSAQYRRNEIHSLLQRLHKQWFAPLEDTIEKMGLGELTIIPHRITHLIPFHALPISSNKSVLDSFVIEYAPSLAIYGSLGTSTPLNPESQVLFVANPDGSLPSSEIEIRRAAKLFRNSISFVGESAGHENVLKNLPNVDLAHFACHASFGDCDASEIGLRLAESSQHSGFLSLRNIAGNIEVAQSSTIVLSACRSGRIKMDAGDEFIGLSSAFIVAGARTVIGTLWPVDDMSTALLMSNFYSSRVCGLSSPRALRRAQLWLRDLTVSEIHSLVEPNTFENFGLPDNPSYTPFGHPYYWAPFFSIGA